VTPELVAAAMKGVVAEIDSAWSTSPKTLRRARLLELTGWAFYVAGRGGVLGDDTRAETVAAAIGVISPDAVRTGWDAARKVGPTEVAACRLAECARWGDECLGEIAADGRLTDLCGRVLEAADDVGMPIFAASRAVTPMSVGPGALAALQIHLMHEHRAGAMLMAVRSCGLTPVEAIIAGRDGEQEAITYGWPPPFPSRIGLLRRFKYAEALADKISGAAYAVLEPGERAELVRLLTTAAAGVKES
jgi:hypothetical protein